MATPEAVVENSEVTEVAPAVTSDNKEGNAEHADPADYADLQEELGDILQFEMTEKESTNEPETKIVAKTDEGVKETKEETTVDPVEKGTKTEEVGEIVEDEVEDEVEVEDDTEITDLRQEINRLNGIINDKQMTTEVPKAEVVKPEVKVVPKTEVIDYTEGVDFDEVFESPEKTNKFLNDFAQKIQESTKQAVMLSIPKVLEHQAQQTQHMTKIVNDFYTEHSDLNSYRPTVRRYVDAIKSEHADWTLDQVLEETAVKTRIALKLPAKDKVVKNVETNSTKVQKKKPKTASRPKKVVELDPLQAELDEMMNVR